MQDSIDKKVIKDRSQILCDLDIELGLKYRRKFLGKTVKILIENDNRQRSGRRERYFTVYLNKIENKQKRNCVVKVNLVKNSKDRLFGGLLN